MLTPAEIDYLVKDCVARAIIMSADKVASILGVKKDSNVWSLVFFGEATESVVSFYDMVLGKKPHHRLRSMAFPRLSATSAIHRAPRGRDAVAQGGDLQWRDDQPTA